MKVLKFHFFICFFACLFQFGLICFEQNTKPIGGWIESMQQILPRLPTQSILEIDSKAIKLAEERGGGIYYPELDAVVPLFPSLIRAEWFHYKNEISERIGPIYPSPTKTSDLWRNSATTIDDLLKDAEMAAPYFLKKCALIANQTGSIASFGIENRNIIKSKKSIKHKVEETMLKEKLSEKEAVSKIRDALRGTLIAETPEQISCIIQALKEFAYEEGREIVFINIWEENRPSGYVGIHAKILLPIRDTRNFYTQRDIIIEIQIHLRCIMDGTIKCVKEREHLLYKLKSKGEIDLESQVAASTLLYLTALKYCPQKPARVIKRPSLIY